MIQRWSELVGLDPVSLKSVGLLVRGAPQCFEAKVEYVNYETVGDMFSHKVRKHIQFNRG